MAHPKYVDIGTVEERAIEECSELIQAICKGERFGWSVSDPVVMVGSINRALSEIKDVELAVGRLKEYLINKRNKANNI